ncbi:MAG: GAF domain-containing sensor histidine kinase [Bacteroidota bacterium]
MDLRQIQQQNEELAILNAIAQDLNREVRLDKALTATLERVVSLLDLQTGWVWLIDQESGSPYVAASHQLPPVFLEQPQLLEGTCYCLERYLRDRMAEATNISEITCTRLKDLKEGTKGLLYHASVPLYSKTQKIGIFNVVSTNLQELPQSRLQLLYTIGDMLSIAIERARLYENSRQAGIVAERNRLARELHDTLAQGLSAISLKLETIDALLEQTSSETKIAQLLQQTKALTKYNLEEARRSVLNLRATPLQLHRLPEALETLIRRVPIEAYIDVQGHYRPLVLRLEMGLYRIAQEAIQNALHHADAQHLYLRLHYKAEQIILSIEDDGKGFDPAQLSPNSFGLAGMAERAKLLNGNLEIKSTPGKGTLIRITCSSNHYG